MTMTLPIDIDIDIDMPFMSNFIVNMLIMISLGPTQ